AFEPQTNCSQFLRCAYSSNVTIYDCALSNYEGSVGMRHAGDEFPNQGASLLSGEKSRSPGSSNVNTVSVDVKRLDDFELPNIGFIKIDAEGEETNVLEGASETLRINQPNLLVEIEQRHRQGDIYDVFGSIEELGYSGGFICDGEFRALKTFSVERHQHARLAGDKSKPYINNFIFRPQK
ncbi:MAG: FkbM family methyltransferase, partial [Gammaproteobacteria bacterium]